MSSLIVQADAEGPLLACTEGLSFWGGVDPKHGTIVDVYHPQHGQSLAGRVVLMPTSRGSCSGSGILLECAINGCAPAALVFREDEDILTLGALIATQMFERPVAVVRLDAIDYDRLAKKEHAQITGPQLLAGGISISLQTLSADDLELTDLDRSMLDGEQGAAAQLAMQTLCTMAAVQGADRLTDVSRAHIDGCIYSGSSNLLFAEKIASLGARVRIPTTTNAISVDRENWQNQGVHADFGTAASRLADAYLQMGASADFTCAPYHSADVPVFGEAVGWSESNAVIYANSVLGARSVKHPDYLDLFIGLTGRAPLSGVYLEENRRPRLVIDVDLPTGYDDSIWPMLGWLTGQLAPDSIPLLTGLEDSAPRADDLRAVCAAYGTTSAAPMLHIAGVTPEARLSPTADTGRERLGKEDFARAWRAFNSGPAKIDLIALGSPHFSLDETRAFAALMEGRRRKPETRVIITLSRETMASTRVEGLLQKLEDADIHVYPDICWCSIEEPIFPRATRTLMTNSGKYAHYAPGLSGRQVRFGSLADCARAAQTGTADDKLPEWLS